MKFFNKIPGTPLYLGTIVFLGIAMVFFTTRAVSNLQPDYLSVGGGALINGAAGGYGLLIPNGDIGVGTTAPTSQLHVSTDNGGDGSILAEGVQANSVTISTLNALNGGNVSINAPATFNATTTLAATTTYIKVGDNGLVNLADVFEDVGPTTEVWTDGSTAFNWTTGRAYNPSTQAAKTNCGLNADTTDSAVGVFYNSTSGQFEWYNVECNLTYSYPPQSPPGWPDGCF